MFGDAAGEEGEGKKEAKKAKDGEEDAEQPKKKRKQHKKDEEYGVSRGMQERSEREVSFCRKDSLTNRRLQESTSRMSPRWSTLTCPHPPRLTPTG